MALEKMDLKKWKFALGEEMDCLEHGREVTIPHTWNVEDGTEEFWGIGWYGFTFSPRKSWRGKRVQVLFDGVYHDAYVYLNGKEVGSHRNSGYTPFVVELTEGIKFDQENSLAVKADNRFSQEMLPYDTSFDWANDGGLIRPVRLLITGKSLMTEPQVIARPVITVRQERQDEGSAVFGLTVKIDGEEKKERFLEWTLYEECREGLRPVCHGKENAAGKRAEIPGKVLPSVTYWHFDNPVLYKLKLSLTEDGELQDEREVVFGFRDFHVEGSRFYLNGEQVRLPGTEWMPGSDPAFGMAEPKEQLEKMLLRLKESNSILTRFHWQQDDWVYDWCDRHGMLVQEEVPFWGIRPPKAGEQQWKIFKEQMEEMVAFHRNHPSIIAWGVGNELDGQCQETIQYIKDAVAYTHCLDPERPVNYVSNSIYKGHSLDGTTDGDIMMINDYIGTWHGNLDQYKEWDAIVKENPDKPMIPSEFGLCEPAFDGGDSRRETIFLEKMACYRTYKNIAGTVYFCLNDYRTQMGEDGQGKLKKRVHGSAGLCGEPKPSYYAVRREYSPLKLDAGEGELTVTCRNDLPSYTVKGYYLKINGETVPIPDMKPGDVWTAGLEHVKTEEVQVYRPNGDRVL